MHGRGPHTEGTMESFDRVSYKDTVPSDFGISNPFEFPVYLTCWSSFVTRLSNSDSTLATRSSTWPPEDGQYKVKIGADPLRKDHQPLWMISLKFLSHLMGAIQCDGRDVNFWFHRISSRNVAEDHPDFSWQNRNPPIAFFGSLRIRWEIRLFWFQVKKQRILTSTVFSDSIIFLWVLLANTLCSTSLARNAYCICKRFKSAFNLSLFTIPAASSAFSEFPWSTGFRTRRVSVVISRSFHSLYALQSFCTRFSPSG
ncbi:hypothetical protein BT63DRAFT_54523 [Microthyrium microscopicum]|uniref:Uncharacterized protein n=1 Tax=Microthyrium microscopicum TaxID=703497 RepID=A0A6A6U1V1_9PEZI|nr:hypothetical protein BT63DRAFT_54523 [Microthyrium microscopicum]